MPIDGVSLIAKSRPTQGHASAYGMDDASQRQHQRAFLSSEVGTFLPLLREQLFCACPRWRDHSPLRSCRDAAKECSAPPPRNRGTIVLRHCCVCGIAEFTSAPAPASLACSSFAPHRPRTRCLATHPRVSPSESQKLMQPFR